MISQHLAEQYPMIRFLFAAVLVSVLSVGSPVHAQGYPNHNINMIVPIQALAYSTPQGTRFRRLVPEVVNVLGFEHGKYELERVA